ncbi:MAG: protein translocase subunit SecF [Oligoflexia bacterium]|nr:protein translocase subunit SecF [Oligoflexia bacterium]
MFEIIRTDLKVDWLKISKPFVWASFAIVILSIILIFTKGLNYGIDFTGGAEVQVSLPADWRTEQVRNALEAGGLPDAKVIAIEDSARNEYIIKTQLEADQTEKVSDLIGKALGAKIPAGSYEIEKVDVVGPQAGKELRFSAIFSVIAAAIGILIYITFRFDFRFGPGIVRALIFDVIGMLGIWIILGREFSLSTVAALLTIAGYSCNDTIVIYDRIRDMAKMHPEKSMYDIANVSISLNLGRTVLTTLSTNFVAVSLWLLGGPVLGDFALAMLIGFTISIPSAIFVATPMVLFMENWIKKSEQKRANSKQTQARPKHA